MRPSAAFAFIRSFFIVLSIILVVGRVHAAPLSALEPNSQGWIPLQSPGQTNEVHRLESSANLLHWQEAALFQDGPIQFSDVTAVDQGARFFRLNSHPRTANDDGKNGIAIPHDRFANEPAELFWLATEKVRWIKFAILLSDDSRVWFQDSARYPFHYDFARLRLEPFQGMTRAEFDRRTLFQADRLAILGAVLISPALFGAEYGIQFVGQDAIPREDIAHWFERVRSAVSAPPGARVFYLPTFEQATVTEQNRDWFENQGIIPATADRWLSQDTRYSDGWALGRLSYVPAAQINAAYADGRLLPTDILLTDRVPAEVPYVSGIITLTPATPNSHVAILARGFGIPFVWFSDPLVRSNLMTLTGREVALRTGDIWSDVRVIDVEGQLPPGLKSELLALRLPPTLNYPVKQRAGHLATNVQTLVPADARFVGGKAANYGLLRRTIPDYAQPAWALTFDVWDDFLDQALPGGGTLRSAITARLAGHTFPPHIATLRTDLSDIRDWFTDLASFPAARKAELLGVLTNAGFDSGRKIRFRSSTNVEDSEDFTGAGLYDSYSGCLLDDLDGDTTGPSACDAAENNERGVFRAIQKVYASFYNENAYLERLRRGVKESEVGMAVLVHHSFPDVDELANGVATLEYWRSFGSEGASGQLVTQLGAVSVSNPDSAAQPEIVSLWRLGPSIELNVAQASTLVPLGDRVMPWDTEYRKLSDLLFTVARGYAELFPAKERFTLDFEYKRMRPGKLDVKQVRPLPEPKPGSPVTPFLLSEPLVWQVLEGEYGEPMAKHRAKSQLRLESNPRRLNPAGLQTSFLRAAEFEFRNGLELIRLTQGPASWPEAGYSYADGTTVDRWSWGTGDDRRRFELRASVVLQTVSPQAPWVTQRDFQQFLKVQYARPQPALSWEGPGFTTVDEVLLTPQPIIDSTSLLQTRHATNASGVLRLTTQFYWPKPPLGPVAGYTAPNIGFVESRIEGLVPGVLILKSPAAQTYSPGHHNFSETFIFEPRLDSSVPSEQLAALEALNIRQLLVTLGFQDTQFSAFAPNGAYRDLK